MPACGIEQLLHVASLPGLSDNTTSSSIITTSRDQQVIAAAAAAAVQFPAIHADALAVLLGMVSLPDGVWQVLCQQNPGVGVVGSSPKGLTTGASGHSAGHTRNNSGSGGVLAAATGGAGGEAAGGMSSSSSGSTPGRQRLLLIDVRRHDERTLYGAIAGAHHVPGGERCLVGCVCVCCGAVFVISACFS